jgi:hypothetical protein
LIGEELMLEILKKAGIASGLAALIVLAITFVPIMYQYYYTKEQNAKIAVLEAKVKALEEKK